MLVPNTGENISGNRVRMSIRSANPENPFRSSVQPPHRDASSSSDESAPQAGRLHTIIVRYAVGAAAAPSPAAAGAALGLPGLGSLSILCSTPCFFSSDETVSDGWAPTLSQWT